MITLLSTEIDEARAIVSALHESAKACPDVQGDLRFQLLRAAGAVDMWTHRYVQMHDLVDKLNAQIAALQEIVPDPTEQSTEPERCEQLKAGIQNELRRLQKTNALLIATQFAANEECEFDVSDAIAAIIERVEQHIETLDQLCTGGASHAQR